MRCCRCSEEAVFDSPRDFCLEHWARWWGGYDAEFPNEDGGPPSEEMYRDALEGGLSLKAVLPQFARRLRR